jgi:hypothetical protein
MAKASTQLVMDCGLLMRAFMRSLIMTSTAAWPYAGTSHAILLDILSWNRGTVDKLVYIEGDCACTVREASERPALVFARLLDSPTQVLLLTWTCGHLKLATGVLCLPSVYASQPTFDP